MDEKQGIKISLSTFFLILAIIVIIIMGYFIYQMYIENNNINNKVEELNSQVSTLENELKTNTSSSNNVENTNINSNSNSITTANESIKTGDSMKAITLNGIYGIKNSDVGYTFTLDGKVTFFTSVSRMDGTYTTIGENEIELNFTEETIVDVETSKKTTNKISQKEKIKYIDKNTLTDEKNNKLIKY